MLLPFGVERDEMIYSLLCELWERCAFEQLNRLTNKALAHQSTRPQHAGSELDCWVMLK